jgi:hypothetical protein
MKRFVVVFTVAWALAGFVLPADAAIILYNVNLDGAQEVPPNASTGTGAALLTLNDVANTLEVNLSYSGLLGTTTGAHIHYPGAPGVNAPIIFNFTAPDFVFLTTSGTYLHTFSLTSEEVAFIESGLSYMNIHTTFIQTGEIRGQINAVPEPSALLLLGCGLLGLVSIGTRRMKQ